MKQVSLLLLVLIHVGLLAIIGNPLVVHAQAAPGICTVTVLSATSATSQPMPGSPEIMLLQPSVTPYQAVERTQDFSWLRIWGPSNQYVWVPFGLRNLTLNGDCAQLPLYGTTTGDPDVDPANCEVQILRSLPYYPQPSLTYPKIGAAEVGASYYVLGYDQTFNHQWVEIAINGGETVWIIATDRVRFSGNCNHIPATR